MTTSKTLSNEQLVDAVVKVLAKDNRVIFAYLCGSNACEGKGNDIDVAVLSGKPDRLLFVGCGSEN